MILPYIVFFWEVSGFPGAHEHMLDKDYYFSASLQTLTHSWQLSLQELDSLHEKPGGPVFGGKF
jgi:hypothetical protein